MSERMVFLSAHFFKIYFFFFSLSGMVLQKSYHCHHFDFSVLNQYIHMKKQQRESKKKKSKLDLKRSN